MTVDEAAALLGVGRDADEEVVLRAWRRLVLVHHPDRQSDADAKRRSHEMMLRLTQARDVLLGRAQPDVDSAAGSSWDEGGDDDEDEAEDEAEEDDDWDQEDEDEEDEEEEEEEEEWDEEWDEEDDEDADGDEDVALSPALRRLKRVVQTLARLQSEIIGVMQAVPAVEEAFERIDVRLGDDPRLAEIVMRVAEAAHVTAGASEGLFTKVLDLFGVLDRLRKADEAMTRRLDRARRLARRVHPVDDDVFLVESESVPGRTYLVDTAMFRCECLDFVTRGSICKHLLAACLVRTDSRGV